jgi:hypothetical protein
MRKEKPAVKFGIVFHDSTDYATIYVAATDENSPRKKK